jgi:hypothetical protein
MSKYQTTELKHIGGDLWARTRVWLSGRKDVEICDRDGEMIVFASTATLEKALKLAYDAEYKVGSLSTRISAGSR